jgi:hypothetical protein
MAKPRAFKIGWLFVTLIGLALLTGSYVWFYFHGWQVVKNMPKQSSDDYPPIWVDYWPPLAQSLATMTGLALFFGGLIFGLSRWVFRFARRLLSPSERVRYHC